MLMAFGIGILTALCISTHFFCVCLGLGTVVLGLVIVRRK